METGNDNRKKRFCLLAGCGLGLLFALLLIPLSNIDPSNTGWVIGGGGDNLQHYLGWRFFRDSRWTRYLLFMRDLNYPVGTSVIVTDSNPLFCLIFKLFRNFLPPEFQFNGIWLLTSWILLGFFAAEVGWRLTRSRLLTLCGVGFALINPVILQRALIHDTLTAHWLILAAVFLFLHEDKPWNPAGWFLLTEAALLIHIYFIPMIAFVFALQLIRMLIGKRSFGRIILLIFVFSASLILGYYVWGYVYILPQSGSYGELSMNLNAFFNPDGASLFLADRPSLPLQYEGFNYWGLGLFVLVTAGLIAGGRHGSARMIPYMVPVPLLILLAASHEGYFDLYQLYSIGLPEKIRSWLSVFRSSGRLVWPLYYLALYASLRAFSRCACRKGLLDAAVCVCLILQIADLSGFCLETARRFRQPGNLPAEIPEGFEEMIPEDTVSLYVSDGDAKDTDALALFAADRHMTYNRIANARSIKKVFGGDELEMDTLSCGQVRPGAVYLFLSPDYPEELNTCGELIIETIGRWTLIRYPDIELKAFCNTGMGYVTDFLQMNMSIPE
ncbi:MAG: hypothetical protein IJI07_05485 [Flexilinea sp.]|nr:hypothetical protein [Flexilinea sp.]